MRTLAVTLIAACVVAACQPQPVRTASANVAAPTCAGDDYLEVTNNTGKAVEIYANLAGAEGQYIGTMPTDSTHLSLAGTPAAGKGAVFYAMDESNGIKYTQSQSDSPVQLIRRCGRRYGPTSN